MNRILNSRVVESQVWGENCQSFVLNDGDDLSVKLEIMPPNATEQVHLEFLVISQPSTNNDRMNLDSAHE